MLFNLLKYLRMSPFFFKSLPEISCRVQIPLPVSPRAIDDPATCVGQRLNRVGVSGPK
jgi:hypothetical protein